VEQEPPRRPGRAFGRRRTRPGVGRPLRPDRALAEEAIHLRDDRHLGASSRRTTSSRGIAGPGGRLLVDPGQVDAGSAPPAARRTRAREAGVPHELGVPQGRVLVAVVVDHYVGRPHGGLRPADGQKDLLVDPVLPPDVGTIAEERTWSTASCPDPRPGPGRAAAEVRRVLVPEAGEEPLRLLPVGRSSRSSASSQKTQSPGRRRPGVAGRGEVVPPGERDHRRAAGHGQVSRPSVGPGVDHDDLVDQVAGRVEAGGDVRLLVPDDQGQTDPRPVRGGRARGGRVTDGGDARNSWSRLRRSSTSSPGVREGQSRPPRGGEIERVLGTARR